MTVELEATRIARCMTATMEESRAWPSTTLICDRCARLQARDWQLSTRNQAYDSEELQEPYPDVHVQVVLHIYIYIIIIIMPIQYI